jgi:thioredoxin-disulfide reductase
MNNYELIIIGGGPAGMTAGIYASRLGLRTLLITKNFGGQIGEKAVAIENYPGFESISGPDLVKKMEKHLKSQKIDIQIDEVLSLKKEDKDFSVLTKGKKEYKTKTLILSTGSDPRPLEVPGEKEFIGKGVSYCALCDGPIFKDKTVAIVGGGNAGFETAIFLARVAKKIYILEFSSQPKAFEQNQKIAEASGKVEIITNAKVKEIKGDKFVELIVYQDQKNNKEKTLEVKGVFVEVGYQPATSYAKGLVNFNKRDEIAIEPETCQTSTPGVFAAGDLNEGIFKQIITAAGEGAKAALAAHNYLQNL